MSKSITNQESQEKVQVFKEEIRSMKIKDFSSRMSMMDRTQQQPKKMLIEGKKDQEILLPKIIKLKGTKNQDYSMTSHKV